MAETIKENLYVLTENEIQMIVDSVESEGNIWLALEIKDFLAARRVGNDDME